MMWGDISGLQLNVGALHSLAQHSRSVLCMLSSIGVVTLC